MKHRWRWGLSGLLLGAAYVLADLLLEWRGKRYVPWSDAQAIGENVGQMIAGVVVFFLIAFVLGYVRDRSAAKEAASVPKVKAAGHADAAVTEWYLFADDVEYGPLSLAQLVAHAESNGLMNVQSNAHVWRQGMSEWKAPADVPELVLALRKEPDAQPADHSRNWIARHWRGDLPLWVSYWVISFVANFTIPVIVAGAALLFHTDKYQPLRSFATIVLIWLGALVVIAWQLVGLWRSARHYRSGKRHVGKWGVWGIAAQVAVVLGVIMNLGAFIKDGVPQLTEVYAIAFRGDPDIPDYSIRVMRNGTEAEIVGGFKYGLTDDFSKVLAASAQIGVVHLDSYGGRIGEGESLHNLIKQRGLVTYVATKCMSACTLAFAAGRERYIAKNATLGFHKGAFPGTDDTTPDQVQRAIFVQAGFEPTFIDIALSTPHESMFKPSTDVLLRAHVITGVAGDGQFAISGMGSNLSREAIAASIARSPTYAAMRDRYPDQFEQLAGAYYASLVAGKSEAETIAALRAQLLPFIKSRIPEADDDVVIESYQVMTDGLKLLRSKNPIWCYQYAMGTDMSFPPEALAPLHRRESSMQERAIRTAAKRAPVGEDAANPIFVKIFSRMKDTGATDDDIDLLEMDTIESAKQPRYCDLSIRFYEELAKLPQGEAATAMRFLLEQK